MDEVTSNGEVDLSGTQQFGMVLFTATVAYGTSKAAEKAFKEVVKAIRNHKASK